MDNTDFAGGVGRLIFTEVYRGVPQNNAEILETEQVSLAVPNRVIKTLQKLNSEQIPKYSPIHLAGHESLGDFIFLPQNPDLSA